MEYTTHAKGIHPHGAGMSVKTAPERAATHVIPETIQFHGQILKQT